MTTHIQTTRWTVDIALDERDGQTVAKATLHTDDRIELVGTGVAVLSPLEAYDIPVVGFEVAAGRALASLGGQLLAAGMNDVPHVVLPERSEA